MDRQQVPITGGAEPLVHQQQHPPVRSGPDDPSGGLQYPINARVAIGEIEPLAAFIEIAPYQIPLRSLIARDGKNLMMAGRNFSAEQLALSSARVSTSGAMMGQAAGVAAAMAARQNCEPRDLNPTEVRQVLIERGADLDV